MRLKNKVKVEGCMPPHVTAASFSKNGGFYPSLAYISWELDPTIHVPNVVASEKVVAVYGTPTGLAALLCSPHLQRVGPDDVERFSAPVATMSVLLTDEGWCKLEWDGVGKRLNTPAEQREWIEQTEEMPMAEWELISKRDGAGGYTLTYGDKTATLAKGPDGWHILNQPDLGAESKKRDMLAKWEAWASGGKSETPVAAPAPTPKRSGPPSLADRKNVCPVDVETPEREAPIRPANFTPDPVTYVSPFIANDIAALDTVFYKFMVPNPDYVTTNGKLDSPWSEVAEALQTRFPDRPEYNRFG